MEHFIETLFHLLLEEKYSVFSPLTIAIYDELVHDFRNGLYTKTMVDIANGK